MSAAHVAVEQKLVLLKPGSWECLWSVRNKCNVGLITCKWWLFSQPARQSDIAQSALCTGLTLCSVSWLVSVPFVCGGCGGACGTCGSSCSCVKIFASKEDDIARVFARRKAKRMTSFGVKS